MPDALYSHTEGQGPDIFLVHGWGVHSGIWGSFAKDLALHYRVTQVDLPGCGRSSFKGQVDDWPRLFAAAPPEAIWLGWSLGGLIATMAALREPQRVKGLITLASSPYFMAQEDWPGMGIETLDKFAHSLEHQYQATLERFLALQCLGMPHAKEEIRRIQENLQTISASPQPLALQQGLLLLKEKDMREALRDIQCPMLHIFGRLDALVPAGIVDHLPALCPQSHIVTIPKASHIPFLSHSALCLETIYTFLSTKAPLMGGQQPAILGENN